MTFVKSIALLIVTPVAFATSSAVWGQEPSVVEDALRRMQDPGSETRLSAIADIQTSLDPRIPDACLHVLQTETEGQSVLRLAARAVGSRWQQIPKDRVPVFLSALKPLVGSEEFGVENMALRAEALLKRKYNSPMVSRSPNGRWVIYERFHSPCLIDTRTETEELLGFADSSEGFFMPYFGNGEVARCVRWREDGQAAALLIGLSRKDRTFWVWRHQKPLLKIDLVAALNADLPGFSGYFVEMGDWHGDQFEFLMEGMQDPDPDFYQFKLRWSLKTERISKVSQTKAE